MAGSLGRRDVLGYRVRVQQLDDSPAGGRGLDELAIVPLGVQDTGTEGGTWSLANRGVEASSLGADDLAVAWTLRGAPHLYRRRDLTTVARATWPMSEADAAKRVFDAAKPLKAAGIPILAALEESASTMAEIVTEPMAKGDVSTAMAQRMPEPYLRWCRVCEATHMYEMPFRLAALHAGLELEAGTSPPVLRPVPGLRASVTGAAPEDPDPACDVVRGGLHLLGPSTPKLVALFLDASLTAVKAAWPTDVTEVDVEGESRSLLDGDADLLDGGLDAGGLRGTRLLGSHDLFLQARDRELLVDDPARAKALWPVIGRPGAVLVDAAVVGLWRPRKKARRLDIAVELWRRESTRLRREIDEQAERLAEHRGVPLGAVTITA